jgi:hypothetical protein
MEYHWHETASRCEQLVFSPGAPLQMYRSLGVYRNSTTRSITGMLWHNRPGERCTWHVDHDFTGPTDSPALEVSIYSSESNYEELWRNAVSATLDQQLWPELETTPRLIRWSLRRIRKLPFIGPQLWSRIIIFVQWLQLLLIFKKHEYYVWCGVVPFCTWWMRIFFFSRLAPAYVQYLEWQSSVWLNTLATMVAQLLGSTLLGLSDSYAEYYENVDGGKS